MLVENKRNQMMPKFLRYLISCYNSKDTERFKRQQEISNDIWRIMIVFIDKMPEPPVLVSVLRTKKGPLKTWEYTKTQDDLSRAWKWLPHKNE